MSRRTLLASAAVSGVAIAAAPAVGRAVTGYDDADAAAMSASGSASAYDSGGVGLPLVAHVRDVRSGRIDIYSGERHVEVHDPALAQRLLELGR